MRSGLIDVAKHDIAEIKGFWHDCEEQSAKVPLLEFEKTKATFIRDLVCDAIENRQAIAKGIIHNWIWARLDGSRKSGAFKAQLARRLLGEDGKPCAATKDLDDADKENLRAAIARAPKPPAPTPPAPPSAAAPASPSEALAPAAAATPSPAASQAK